MSSQQRQESLQVYITAYVTGVTGYLRVTISSIVRMVLYRTHFGSYESGMCPGSSRLSWVEDNPSLWLPPTPGFPLVVREYYSAS